MLKHRNTQARYTTFDLYGFFFKRGKLDPIDVGFNTPRR